MQIKLETKTATFGKSTFLDHVVVKSTNGNTIILELTGKQLTDKRKILEPGCHVYYQDEEYTILCFGNVLAKPADIVLELDRDFPTETYNIYFLTKCNIKNVQGDLQGSTLRLFVTQRDRRDVDFKWCIIQRDNGQYYKINSHSFQKKKPHYLIAEVEELVSPTYETLDSLLHPAPAPGLIILKNVNGKLVKEVIS